MSLLDKPTWHKDITRKLARKLRPEDVYEWLVTVGYFPESFVLPPSFAVSKFPPFGTRYAMRGGKFNPRLSRLIDVHFPKTELADRTFEVIDPELHCDMAYLLAVNWKFVLQTIFHPKNMVSPYSFPIPLDAKRPGVVGRLRSGRMIYEFIEMAENDLATEAYRFQYLVKTDVKNFYPSVYTHSIAWALHGKTFIRNGRRYDYSLLGNQLDKLFQNANDGCTNGIPIGPAVSDLIAEIILAGADRIVSKILRNRDVIVVRFKDDYRILCIEEQDAKTCVKALQSAFREYDLELNEEKTCITRLPDGIFRPWVSLYHAANPRPKRNYSYKAFREAYLSVIAIDRQTPGSGVIDRFLADIVQKNDRLRITIDRRNLPKILSLLLMLADRRIKAFPKVLAILEAIIKTKDGVKLSKSIQLHLNRYLHTLARRESENKYLISWILYFLASNNLYVPPPKKYKFKDPVVRSIHSNRGLIFRSSKNFRLYIGTKAAAKQVSLLRHLDVFPPQ